MALLAADSVRHLVVVGIVTGCNLSLLESRKKDGWT